MEGAIILVGFLEMIEGSAVIAGWGVKALFTDLAIPLILTIGHPVFVALGIATTRNLFLATPGEVLALVVVWAVSHLRTPLKQTSTSFRAVADRTDTAHSRTTRMP
jgi:hypothetical protein